MTIHKLKTLPQYWNAVNEGVKTFEVRKNDRGFQTGDIVYLEKYFGEKGDDSGHRKYSYHYTHFGTDAGVYTIKKRITYILQGGQLGIEPQYCILGLGDIDE